MLKVTALSVLEHVLGKEFISQLNVYVTVTLQLLTFLFLLVGITQAIRH